MSDSAKALIAEARERDPYAHPVMHDLADLAEQALEVVEAAKWVLYRLDNDPRWGANMTEAMDQLRAALKKGGF